MSTHNLCFDQKYEKYPNFYLKIFIFWWLKCSVYLNRLVFVMRCLNIMVIRNIYIFLILTLSMFGKNSAEDILKYFFLFLPEHNLGKI